MVLLHHIRRYSTRYNTWCYRQGFYRYDKVKKKEKYGPLICKYIDIPIINEEFAKEHGAKWDRNEKKWVIEKYFMS
jgi:hypothetical protein